MESNANKFFSMITLTQPVELVDGALDPSESRQLTISGTVSDQSSLKTLAFSWVNDGGGSKYLSVSEKDLVNGTFTKSVDFDNSQGSWNIQWVVVEDTAGNAAKSYEMSSEEFLATTGIDTTGWLNFAITDHADADNSPPIVVLTQPTELSNSILDPSESRQLTISGTVSDQSSLKTLAFSWVNDGGGSKYLSVSEKDLVNGTFTKSVDFDNSQGSWNIQWVVVEDTAGNAAKSYEMSSEEFLATTGIDTTGWLNFAITEHNASHLIIRGNSIYTIVDGPSWTEAEVNSVKLGGHLVSLSSAEEQNFVVNYAESVDNSRPWWWMGLEYNQSTNTFQWFSGEDNTYKNWFQGNGLTYPDVSLAEGIYGHTEFTADPGRNWTGATADQGQWAVALPSSERQGVAEIPFIRRGDSAYVIVEGPTWEEAEANANALGGHLVTINDAEENAWVVETYKSLGRSPLSASAPNAVQDKTFSLWIGATDKDKEGTWLDSTGNALAYTNWYSSEPNNVSWYDPNGEDYAAISFLDPVYLADGWQNGTWVDLGKNPPNADHAFAGIAEIKLAPNKTPTGAPTLSGDFKVGEVISIDRTPIQDADNFEGWTPTYKYSWEVANDPGLTQVMPIGESLTTADATDGDENLEITDELTGKLIRGVVSYMDGYGTNEIVYSDARIAHKDSLGPFGPSTHSISYEGANTKDFAQQIASPYTQRQEYGLEYASILGAEVTVTGEGGWSRRKLIQSLEVTEQAERGTVYLDFTPINTNGKPNARVRFNYRVLGDTVTGEHVITEGTIDSIVGENGDHHMWWHGHWTTTAQDIKIETDYDLPGISNLQLELQFYNVTAEGSEFFTFDTGFRVKSGVHDWSATSLVESTLENALDTFTPLIRGNSIYTIVDGPSWTEAEANAVKLGGHLATINDNSENTWIANTYRDEGISLPMDSLGTRNIFIGLTRSDDTGAKYENSAGKSDGWISGDSSSFRPDYWGNTEGKDPDGVYTALVWGEGKWNDFPEWQHTGVGLAEIPFIRRGDSAYVIVQGPTWEEAEANANALGGHLVTINDVEENEWLISSGIVGDGKWIGFSDRKLEGNWTWSDLSASTYANWYAGQPDNSIASDSVNGQDYAVLGRQGYWDDGEDPLWPGIAALNGIAEIKLAPNNSPTGTPTLSENFKVGEVISIDRTPIQDADNFEGWTPTYQYSWEVADDPGLTQVIPIWETLSTTDATDGDENLEITDDLTGKFIRGVVSYVDGYGTHETVYSSSSTLISTETRAPAIRGNSLYFIIDGPSWSEAETNSISLGGNLASINTREEQDYVIQKFSEKILSISQSRVWIGLNDEKQEGSWVWSSGDKLDYTNWNTGEPNNFFEEDYTAMYAFGRWNDQPDNSYLYGLAEIPFIRRGDSAYVIVEGPTWEEAEANANTLGGHLVTINDADENEWITNNLLNGKEYWIGLSDPDLDKRWKWADNSDSTYRNWNPGEPNGNDTTWRDIYGVIRADWQGTWNDWRGPVIHGGIAEIKLAPNNAPTGSAVLTGNLIVGEIVSIDNSSVQDPDNFAEWTPSYKYSWEIASDPAVDQEALVWEPLSTNDATDGSADLQITASLTGKLIRGVISYMDGYGTNETVYSSGAKVEASLPTQRLISLPTDLTAKVGQIIEVPITINQAQDLQALDLKFAFDPELFSAPTSGGLVRSGTLTSAWSFSGNVDVVNNTLRISGYSSQPLTGQNGDLAYLRLQVKGTAPRGEAVLDVISASLNENELSVELQDGSLTITAPKVSISSDLKVPIGGSIGIPITIDDATDLQSIDLVFAYDPTVFSLPASGEIVSGSDLTSNWSFAANTETPGQIKISGYGTTPLEDGEGGLVNLNLKINSGVDTGNVLLDLVSVSFNEGAITADLVDGTLELLPPTFQVMDVRQTASGLALKLSEAPDLEKLNLYDGQDQAIDLPDLRLTRSNGTAVEDLSVHWKAETSELYVIHTDSLTGISQNQFGAGASPFQSDLLAAGDYTLVIDARSDGLVSASSGELIDGNGDGITGDAFSYSFTKSTPSNLISIADTARGSGQSLGLNGIAQSNGINGLPVLISTSAAIRSLRGTVTYDATAFNNASLVVGRDLPEDWTLETQEDVIGSLNYTASGTTAITGTDQELFRFDAVVSQDATYGSSTLIEATVEAPDDPSLSFESDPGLVALAYSGDTTGNGGHSSLDASLIQRVVVELDTGFDAYDSLAPSLIADTTGNGGISSLDASRVQQQVVGLPVDSFPVIPDPVPVI